MIKIRTRKRKEERSRIFYVCNRKKCGKNCTPGCRYTPDINFALYKEHYDFSPEDSGLFERIRNGKNL